MVKPRTVATLEVPAFEKKTLKFRMPRYANSMHQQEKQARKNGNDLGDVVCSGVHLCT
jgi:hypothetical protein